MNILIKPISPSDELFKNVLTLRSNYIGDNPAGEMDFSLVDSMRDTCSYHMAYLDGEEVVGAIRMTPMGHGLSFIERALDISPYFSNPFETFEANRLVLNERYRGGKHLRHFLLKTAIWMLGNTTYKHISALCRGELAAIYVGVGGKLLTDNIHWETESKSRKYSLVSLDLLSVYETIRRREKDGNERALQ